jgi:hypothetical protein
MILRLDLGFLPYSLSLSLGFFNGFSGLLLGQTKPSCHHPFLQEITPGDPEKKKNQRKPSQQINIHLHTLFPDGKIRGSFHRTIPEKVLFPLSFIKF